MMGVFLDELGPFEESLRFFGYAARMCPGDSTTLELRQLLAVPVVFSSQNELDLFIAELKIYPSLTSSFEPQNPDRSEETLIPGDDHKRRRVGFISSWFRSHSVGKLLLGVVQNLDRAKFHVIIYRCVHFLRDGDKISELFKHTADEYVELPETQDPAVHILRQAQLDIAIFPELGMDEWTVLLSHHRVAPIQCVFWGHPITTGNPNIDYFISSEHFVSDNFDEPTESTPVNEQLKLSGYRRSSFSEQIVLFRGLSTIFTEPNPLTIESREITRSRLYLPTNRRLYVCPQVSALC
ncbi:Ankyrin repeat domain-containing protein 50 [Phytophthora nicotianae]|uniref:Ankyrin repeat domain-containing protein 50 n=1 Tax=Phytophthora nicotianae TaxID=4792 RepID=A0A0W8CYU7_PHYNI|nr:Ankyrin repeat domain-containing protein 50 [Phytophthora nicotianae]